METKDELVKTIKEWVRLDSELKALQKEISHRKAEKKRISALLMDTMKKNEIDVFDIKNGQIMYVKKNVKKAMTKKVLFDVLAKYYEGDVTKATEMREYIMLNRDETVREAIVCKTHKA
jgi:hypothetical protein